MWAKIALLPFWALLRAKNPCSELIIPFFGLIKSAPQSKFGTSVCVALVSPALLILLHDACRATCRYYGLFTALILSLVRAAGLIQGKQMDRQMMANSMVPLSHFVKTGDNKVVLFPVEAKVRARPGYQVQEFLTECSVVNKHDSQTFSYNPRTS